MGHRARGGAASGSREAPIMYLFLSKGVWYCSDHVPFFTYLLP